MNEIEMRQQKRQIDKETMKNIRKIDKNSSIIIKK